MNRLNKTESDVFLYCRFSLVLTDPFSRLFRGHNSCRPLCHVELVNLLPVHGYSVDLFHILVLQECWVLTECRILLKPVLNGVRIVALSISWSPTSKLNFRLLRKRELIALLLLYSVDVMFLLSFFVSSSRCLFNDCCISWLNSLTDSYMIRQNSEYDQELPQSQTEDCKFIYV